MNWLIGLALWLMVGGVFWWLARRQMKRNNVIGMCLNGECVPDYGYQLKASDLWRACECNPEAAAKIEKRRVSA